MFQTPSFRPGSGSRIPGRKNIRCLGASQIWTISAFCLSFLSSGLPAVVTLEVGKSGGAAPFPHSNGRQIGSNKDGIWLVAYDGKAAGGRTIFLAASRSDDPEFAGDFHPPVALAGKSAEPLISGGKGDAFGASFVIDPNDVLHLIWQSSNPQGIWYSRCSVQGEAAEKIREGGNWTRPQRVDDSAQDPQLGDLTVDDEGRLWVSYSQSTEAAGLDHYYLQAGGERHSHRLRRRPADQVWVATQSEGAWKRKPLTVPGDFRSPVMDLDPTGALHLVFFRDNSWFLFYLQIPDFASAFASELDLTRILPHGPWSGSGYVNYSVVGLGEQALVVFEKVEHVILYAHFDGQNWSREPLHFSQEKLHRPQLARDEHGVVWVFWTNSARGHTFYSRWLGKRFGAPYECRTLVGDPFAHEEGSLTLPTEATTGPRLSDFHSVQKQMSSGSGKLGVAIASTGSSGGVYFDRVVVPDLEVEAGRKVLFLDMLEISAMGGLTESFQAMKKHPSNPVLETGPPGSFDDLRAHAYGEVLYEDGKFRMWYSGLDLEMGRQGIYRHHIGYAESEDGVNWIKPRLNQVEFRGSKANNIVDLDYRGRSAFVPLIVKDERDPDPSRRYKAVVMQRGNTIHYSPDGIRWSSGGTVKGNFGDRRNLFYDSLEPKAERRWKVLSHCSGPDIADHVRKTCRYWSADLMEWTDDPRNPVMHPRAGTEVEQHLTSVWPYAGMYLGMFDIWDTAQRMPQALIASRDGVNFVHVFDGQSVIELGQEGEWDTAWISPANLPLEVEDELWYYYSGSTTTIGPNYFEEWTRLPISTGLATIRRDGFVSLKVEKDSGAGWFTTIPLKSTATSLQLEINAEGLSQGEGRVLVELLENGKVVARSNAVIGDGVEVPVLWPNEGQKLNLSTGAESLQLQFRLEGQAQLYGFTFK